MAGECYFIGNRGRWCPYLEDDDSLSMKKREKTISKQNTRRKLNLFKKCKALLKHHKEEKNIMVSKFIEEHNIHSDNPVLTKTICGERNIVGFHGRITIRNPLF